MNRFCWQALFLFPLFAALVGANAGVVYDNGSPDRNNGFEITHWIEADVFSVTAAARIEGAKFWTFEIDGNFEGTLFWQIYSLGNGIDPGTVLFSGTTSAVSHVATGLIAFGFKEYVATFSIDPVFLPAGSYWLSIHNGPSQNSLTQNVFWQTTGQQGSTPSRSDIFPYLGAWESNGTPAELAFLVTGTPAPTITSFARPSSPQIRFTTVSGGNYRVEFRNSLDAGMWAVVPGAENIPGTGGTVQITDSDPNVGGHYRRFYRVILL
ncbi:MAG: hypothetical protein ACR2HH_07825 [Chthoniobacterales bacterium]